MWSVLLLVLAWMVPLHVLGDCFAPPANITCNGFPLCPVLNSYIGCGTLVNCGKCTCADGYYYVRKYTLYGGKYQFWREGCFQCGPNMFSIGGAQLARPLSCMACGPNTVASTPPSRHCILEHPK